MELFSSFDTKFDEQRLSNYIEEYWKWNVFLVKRNKYYLIIISLYLFFLTTILWILLIVSYYQYHNIIFKYIVIIWYLLWIWLWLFYLFKLIWHYFWWWFESYKTKISKDDFKDWNYEGFMRHSIFLLIFQFFLLILNIILNYYDYWIKKWSFGNIWLIILQIILNILFLILFIKTLKKVFDFENDFVIVTPDKIEVINQKSLFSRWIKTLDTEKIKSISVNKKWFIKSFLWIWQLSILAEWDESNNWEIELKWIYNPEKIQKKIEKIINIE